MVRKWQCSQCGIMLKNAWEIHNEHSSTEGNREAGHGPLEPGNLKGGRLGRGPYTPPRLGKAMS